MQFDTLYLELIDSTNMIRSLLQGITDEQARVRPAADAWSILEVICHLYDEEREDFREHLNYILNRGSREWHRIDPQAWVTARKYNEQEFRDIKEKWLGERSRSLDWLKSLTTADWDTSCPAPFGSLSAGELFASWVAHDNLHLRQLVELRRAHIETITKPYSIAYAGDW